MAATDDCLKFALKAIQTDKSDLVESYGRAEPELDVRDFDDRFDFGGSYDDLGF